MRETLGFYDKPKAEALPIPKDDVCHSRESTGCRLSSRKRFVELQEEPREVFRDARSQFMLRHATWIIARLTS